MKYLLGDDVTMPTKRHAKPTRLVMRFLILLAVLYAAACLLLFFGQRKLLYFPQGTRVSADQTDFSLQRPDATLRGWVVNPHGNAPVIYFGGNAEPVQYQRDFFRQVLPDRSIYLVAYRGYGASDGEPRFRDILPDAVAIFDEVQKRHPGQPISVIGRSLGSGVAAHVASQRAVSRLVLVTPYDSMARVGQHHYGWLPVRWLLRERYDNVAALQGDTRTPVMVIRASDDQVVPAANTDALVQAIHPHEVVLVPQSNHDSIGASPLYAQSLARFLR